MFSAIVKHVKNVSVLRRLIFALSHLPEELPDVWKYALQFATMGMEDSVQDKETLKLLLDNLKEIDSTTFESDKDLYLKLLDFPDSRPLGIVLMPIQTFCLLCGGNLLVRKDRPSKVVVYNDDIGTVSGSHYHKTCTNRDCGCIQYYGYYTKKGSTKVFYNCDWESLPFFSSSRDTFFSTKLMKRFDAGVLLGQQSFKQCADIYNHLHKCNLQQDEDSKYVRNNVIFYFSVCMYLFVHTSHTSINTHTYVHSYIHTVKIVYVPIM